MIGLLTAVAVASVLGSLHCVGMCGGFVAFYSGSDPSAGRHRMVSHAAYSGARLVAYAVLGGIAGGIGAALDVAGSLAGVQRVAAVVAGVAMIAWGVVALLRIRGLRLPRHRRPAAPSRWLRQAFAAIGHRPPVVRATLVGLLSGLLPCGWLWAFLVTAAGTGDVLRGVAVMAAFWAGTVPALVAVGVGAQLVGGQMRRHVPALTALLLVVLGLLALTGRPTSVAAAVAERESAGSAAPVPDTRHEGGCCTSPSAPPADRSPDDSGRTHVQDEKETG